MEPSEEHRAKASRRPFGLSELAIWSLGILLAVVLRFSLFDFESGDYAGPLSSWYG